MQSDVELVGPFGHERRGLAANLAALLEATPAILAREHLTPVGEEIESTGPGKQPDRLADPLPADAAVA